MKSNLDFSQLDKVGYTAKKIREWIEDINNPDYFSMAQNLENIRDFVNTLDLLETVLCRFEISVRLSIIALRELEDPSRIGSLGWNFWQIDVEEFFASNLLELCYQVSNAWEELDVFAKKHNSFKILNKKHIKPSATLIARHKATHFQPSQFEKHVISKKYSILRRPYRINDNKLEKELAKETMPRVAKLIHDAFTEGLTYLEAFYEATKKY